MAASVGLVQWHIARSADMVVQTDVGMEREALGRMTCISLLEEVSSAMDTLRVCYNGTIPEYM